ncbi:MAG: hypothetical protein JRI67_13435 [Deltaproteobacteria bacterium]|nr:hypothetical protein [Deltaproteobacteria bacterium]
MKKQIWIISLIFILAMSMSVNAAVPPDPTNLVSDKISSSGHVIWSWEAGEGDVTDLFYISINGVWTNDSCATTYDHNVGAGKTSTIIVYAYNETVTAAQSTGNVTGSVIAIQSFSSIVDVISSVVPLLSSMLDISSVVPLLSSMLDLILAAFPVVIGIVLLSALSLLILGVLAKVTKK